MPSTSKIARLTADLQEISRTASKYKTKEDALKAAVADLTKQVATAKKQIADLSDIASPLGESVINVWLKKEKAHLTNREKMLREVKKELAAEQAKSAKTATIHVDPRKLSQALNKARLRDGAWRSGDNDQELAQAAGVDWNRARTVWKMLEAGDVPGWSATFKGGYYWLVRA